MSGAPEDIETPAIARLVISRVDADGSSRTDQFDVPFEQGASVLDGLIWIRRHTDPSLAFRYSCISANVCKECTMMVDGKVAYACTARLKPGQTILEPLRGKRVLRDLVTDTIPPKERLIPSDEG